LTPSASTRLYFSPIFLKRADTSFATHHSVVIDKYYCLASIAVAKKNWKIHVYRSTFNYFADFYIWDLRGKSIKLFKNNLYIYVLVLVWRQYDDFFYIKYILFLNMRYGEGGLATVTFPSGNSITFSSDSHKKPLFPAFSSCCRLHVLAFFILLIFGWCVFSGRKKCVVYRF
jgi:hypothetical protein